MSRRGILSVIWVVQGASTGAHLHFEVQPIKWNGYYNYISKNNDGVRKYAVDPYPYILDLKDRLEMIKNMTADEAKKIVQEKAQLDNNTMQFLNFYKYNEALIIKLANAMQ